MGKMGKEMEKKKEREWGVQKRRGGGGYAEKPSRKLLRVDVP